MQIFKLKPYCAQAIWGGTNLYKKYGKNSGMYNHPYASPNAEDDQASSTKAESK